MASKFEQELTERAVAEAKISAMVMDDPALREKLLADPRAALVELAGIEIDESVKVVVHEESADTFHLVIPPALPDELSEDQLEAVAGGAAFGGVITAKGAKKIATAAGTGAVSGGASAGVKKASSKW